MHEAEDPRGPLPALIDAQHGAGGWGWRPGQAGNTECTALAVLALHAHRSVPAATGAFERGATWLRSHQLPDGSWPTSKQVPASSWMTCLAVLALHRVRAGDAQAVAGAEWLLGQHGRSESWLDRALLRLFRGTRMTDQDPNLLGWAWNADTSAWVEPTAWSLLATKQLLPYLPRRSALERIRQAELMLADRMCIGGGWNYGNKVVAGEALPPYPDTTALALLALHDAPANDVTGVSNARLAGMLTSNRSTLVLALACLARQLYDLDVSGLRFELRLRTGGGSAIETRTLALALLALDEGERHFQVNRNA